MQRETGRFGHHVTAALIFSVPRFYYSPDDPAAAGGGGDPQKVMPLDPSVLTPEQAKDFFDKSPALRNFVGEKIEASLAERMARMNKNRPPRPPRKAGEIEPQADAIDAVEAYRLQTDNDRLIDELDALKRQTKGAADIAKLELDRLTNVNKVLTRERENLKAAHEQAVSARQDDKLSLALQAALNGKIMPDAVSLALPDLKAKVKVEWDDNGNIKAINYGDKPLAEGLTAYLDTIPSVVITSTPRGTGTPQSQGRPANAANLQRNKEALDAAVKNQGQWSTMPAKDRAAMIEAAGENPAGHPGMIGAR